MSLAVLISTESRVAGSYRDGIKVGYVAAAVIERVLPDLAAEVDLSGVLAGVSVSSFTDGPPGLRRMPDGTFMDLHTLTSMVSCGQPTCSEADLDEVREDRPWGRNNPRWQLYAHGELEADGRVYAVVWVADDASETDMDPLMDGASEDDPGRGRLAVLAHAYGPAGTRRVVEATVSTDERGMRLLSWREIR
jgi:hypothetical protein